MADDVLYVYSGLTPAESGTVRGEVGRSKKAVIIDHSEQGDIDGLISVVGVTYTSARSVAERTATLAQRKLGAGTTTVKSRTERLPGAQGQLPDGNDRVPEALDDRIADLLSPYGTRLPAGIETNPGSFTDVYSACIRHAARNEMAVTLDDVLLRRMDLVERGLMTRDLVGLSAQILAEELGWEENKTSQASSDMVSGIRYLAGAS